MSKRPAGYKGPPKLNDIDGLLSVSELGSPAGDPLFSCDTKMPSTLVGKEYFLFKTNAQIHFDHGEISVLDGTGHPIQVLSLTLRDK